MHTFLLFYTLLYFPALILSLSLYPRVVIEMTTRQSVPAGVWKKISEQLPSSTDHPSYGGTWKRDEPINGGCHTTTHHPSRTSFSLLALYKLLYGTKRDRKTTGVMMMSTPTLQGVILLSSLLSFFFVVVAYKLIKTFTQCRAPYFHIEFFNARKYNFLFYFTTAPYFWNDIFFV